VETRVPDPPRPTILERLDLALAARITDREGVEDNDPAALLQIPRRAPSAAERPAWIAGLLGLRGFRVGRDDVARALAREPGRFRPEHQEFKLIVGFGDLLPDLLARAALGRSPDGWWLVEGFRRVTERIERFRNNTLRRDAPWDAIVGVPYAEPAEIQARIDGLHAEACFGDDPAVHAGLHPVRQAARLMWRFARIAPFPDFNLPFAALAFAGHLLAKGYPALLPQPGDRAHLERLVRGRLPRRAVGLEARLLDQVIAARAGAN
jgi:hypothetical protein